jgi:hypothetical protein
MIDYATYCQIKDDQRQGLTVAQIAQARGLHRHTVTAWLAHDRVTVTRGPVNWIRSRPTSSVGFTSIR